MKRLLDINTWIALTVEAHPHNVAARHWYREVELLRGDLVIHIRKVIDKLGITQVEAAKRAGITQPRMNDLVKNRTHKFTLDALVNVAANLGYSVQLKFKKAA